MAGDKRRNTKIEDRPLGYALGGEILGVDMRDLVDDATVEAMHRVWHEHHVMVLRDQDAGPDDICDSMSTHL